MYVSWRQLRVTELFAFGTLRVGHPLARRGSICRVLTRRMSNRIGAMGPHDSPLGRCQQITYRQPASGHTGQVNSVAFSTVRRQLASASDDCTNRYWGLASGALISRPVSGYAGSVNCVVFSADGTQLASALYDSIIHPRDVLNGALIGQPRRGHTSLVYSVALLLDGRQLASTSIDNNVRLWDAVGGAPKAKRRRGYTRTVHFVGLPMGLISFPATNGGQFFRGHFFWRIHPAGKRRLEGGCCAKSS